MFIVEAITRGLSRYFKYASRAEYWYWLAFYLVLVLGVALIEDALPTTGGFGGLAHIIAFVLLSPTVAVSVRRMHDIGRSGWCVLAPLYGYYLAAQLSQPVTNIYGAEPGQNEAGGALARHYPSRLYAPFTTCSVVSTFA